MNALTIFSKQKQQSEQIMALPHTFAKYKLEKILATQNSQTKVYIAKPPYQFYKQKPTQFCIYVAIKSFPQPSPSNPVTKYLFDCQLKALRTLQNKKNIVKVFDIVNDNQKGYCYVIMQYCERGTLNKYLDKLREMKCLDQLLILRIFRKILDGYQEIIDALMLHRDIKPSNILIRDSGEPIFIDFGYSEDILNPNKPAIKYNVGSPSYMAPQAFLNCRFSQKSDVWSLGMMLYYMVTSKTLDERFQAKEYFDQLTKNSAKILDFKQISGKYETLIKDVLKSALQMNPDKRATCRKLKYIIDKEIIGELNANKLTRSAKILPTQGTSRVNYKVNFLSPDKQTPQTTHQTAQSKTSRIPELKIRVNTDNDLSQEMPQQLFSSQKQYKMLNPFAKKSDPNVSFSIQEIYANNRNTYSDAYTHKKSPSNGFLQKQFRQMQVKNQIHTNKSFDPSHRKSSNDQIITSPRSNLINNPSQIRIDSQINRNSSYIPQKPSMGYVSEKYSDRSNLSDFRKTNPNPQFPSAAQMKNMYVQRPLIHHKGYHFDYYGAHGKASPPTSQTPSSQSSRNLYMSEKLNYAPSSMAHGETNQAFMSTFKKMKNDIIQNRNSQQNSHKTNPNHLVHSLRSPKVAFKY